MLTDQAKIDYQREYMRKRRSTQAITNSQVSVSPKSFNMGHPGEENLSKTAVIDDLRAKISNVKPMEATEPPQEVCISHR